MNKEQFKAQAYRNLASMPYYEQVERMQKVVAYASQDSEIIYTILHGGMDNRGEITLEYVYQWVDMLKEKMPNKYQIIDDMLAHRDSGVSFNYKLKHFVGLMFIEHYPDEAYVLKHFID